MDALKLDPAAMTAYTTVADTVSQQLASAAVSAGGAVNPEQLAVDLGVVGADFAAAFTAAVSDHVQALSTAGKLVYTYGQVLRGYNTDVQESDSDTAAAIGKVGETLI